MSNLGVKTVMLKSIEYNILALLHVNKTIITDCFDEISDSQGFRKNYILIRCLVYNICITKFNKRQFN